MTRKSRAQKPSERRHLTVVSLYSGAGGLDYGFESAGFDTRVAVEMDRDCCRTLRLNREWPVLEADIHETSSAEILDAARMGVGQPDVLIGGPPCQPFSKSAYWTAGDTKRLSDPRARTLDEYMRCVDEMQPRVFLLENVHGINYSGKEEGFRLLARLTEETNKRRGTNYVLNWAILNTADYGVPQTRQRFFLVGNRDGRRFRFPPITHGDGANGAATLFKEPSREPHVTAWEALADIRPRRGEDLALKGYWGDLLESIPEGENYLWHTNRKGGLPLFGWRTRYWSFLLKLAKGRPAWTLQAQPGPAIGPFHWKNRRLSVEEMARLQTFPRNLSFAGSRMSIQKQLGNAVPSLLAEILAREIARQLLDRSVKKEPVLTVARRRRIPPPGPVGPVPDKYMIHVGNHPDHPGEGKGRRALGVERVPLQPAVI